MPTPNPYEFADTLEPQLRETYTTLIKEAQGRIPIKERRRWADPHPMKSELCCPVCSADVPLGGDERRGEQVSCTFCGSPLTIAGKSEDDMELEEDF